MQQLLKHSSNPDKLRSAFSIFDKQGQGHVTSKDLKFTLNQLGLNPTEDEIQDLFHEIEQDGRFTVEEFNSLVESDVNQKIQQEEMKEIFTLLDKKKKGQLSVSDV